MRYWTEQNWGSELRVVGIVRDRFGGKPMMTSPVLDIYKRPLRIKGQPDLLDDGMVITTLSGSRYFLDSKNKLGVMPEPAKFFVNSDGVVQYYEKGQKS